MPLLKFIERGLQSEISAIYEALRDLLLAKHYIETYCAVIERGEDGSEDETNAEMWIR